MNDDEGFNEPILPDDYPIYGGYFYIVDGTVVTSDWHGITAKQLAAKFGGTVVRRCDAVKRGLFK